MFRTQNLLTLFCLVLSMGSLRASVLAEHVGERAPGGDDDPTLWTKVTEGRTSEEPVPGEKPAWRISDQGNGVLYYEYPSPLPDLEGKGWKLSACLLVDRASGEAAEALRVEFADAKLGMRYYLGFFLADSGELTLTVNSPASSVTINASDAAQFHLYEIVYDPVANLAKLLIDGEESLDSIPPLKNSKLTRLLWGCGSTQHTGSADFNLVRLETLP